MGAPPQVGENGREDCMGVGYVKGTKYRWDLQLVRHKGAILGHISTPGTREPCGWLSGLRLGDKRYESGRLAILA